MQKHKPVVFLSMVLITLFFVAQFVFKNTGSTGPWCSPALPSLPGLGHPMYGYVDYGAPFPIMEILTNICAEPPSTTYNWLPVGLGVNGLLLMLLAYPLWSPFLKKKVTNKEIL